MTHVDIDRQRGHLWVQGELSTATGAEICEPCRAACGHAPYCRSRKIPFACIIAGRLDEDRKPLYADGM
jgi:hypothetical protein